MPAALSIHPARFCVTGILLIISLVVIGVSPVAAAPLQQLDAIDAVIATPPGFEDDFSTDQDVWSTTYDGETSRFFKSGRFYIAVDVSDTVAYSRADLVMSDFYAEVDTYHMAGSIENQLGLIFRYVDGSNFYFFAIGNDGYYALLKLLNNSWVNIIDWTETDAINTGIAGRNHLGLLVDGPTITLLINDEIVAEVNDNSFSSGQIALSAGTYEAPSTEIAFDNFALWRLDDPATGETPAAPPLRTNEAATDDDLQSRLDALRALAPNYVEDFTREDGGWDVFETENVLAEYFDEALHIYVRAPQRLGTSALPRSVSNFLLEINVEYINGPSDAEAGVIFRYIDENNYYLYAISADGYYSLWRKRNAQWHAIVEWTSTDALATGPDAQNRLTILAQGESIILLANDNILAETTDSAFNSGTIAVVVGTFEEGEAEFAFDSVYIWDIESEAPVLPPAQRREPDDINPDGINPDDISPDDTDTPAPDPTPDPAETFDAEARLDEILATPSSFHDDFRRNTGMWSLTEEDGVSFTYRQRAILGVVDVPDWMAWTILDLELSDFYFEVDTTVVDYLFEAIYGLVFRLVDANNFYYAAIDPYGNYTLWKKVDGQWEELAGWTSHDAIEFGDEVANRLGVLAEGPHISLTVNGEVIHTLVDSDLTSGFIGLMIESDDIPGVQVLFDNAELWDLR